VRATVHQFKTIEQMQQRKKGEHMNSFRTVMANTVQKLEREASDKSLTEKQRAQKLSNMHEIVVQMKDIMKKHQDLDIQHFVDDHLYRDVMTEMLNSVELTFMGRFIIKSDHHEYKSATCVVFISTDIKGGIKCPVALKFMKNAGEFEQEKSSRLKLKGSDAADISKFVVDIRDSFDCSHALFEQSLNGSSSFVINSKLQDYPSLIVMPAADRNLRAIMDNERITDPTALKRMFHEVLLAVKYMHDRGVIHGDIKPRNVVRINEQLVVIDLDASAEIGKQFSWSKYSSAYLPPEAIAIRRHESVASLSCTTSASVRCFAWSDLPRALACWPMRRMPLLIPLASALGCAGWRTAATTCGP
jgi:serine/threonine protein kinase